MKKLASKLNLKPKPRPTTPAVVEKELSIVFKNGGIRTIEKKYDATFVGDFPLPLRGGGWGEPAAVFWQKEIPEEYRDVPGVSNYVAVFHNNGQTYVTSGSYLIGRDIYGKRAQNGEIIYSRHRHDYRKSEDGVCMVDGGFDYYRCNLGGEDVILRLIGPELVETRLNPVIK